MQNIKAQLKREKRWWSSGADIEFRVSAELSKFELCPLVDSITRGFLPSLYTQSNGENLLVNIKGQSPGTGFHAAVQENEVLFYAGQLAVSEVDESYEWENTTVCIAAELHEFTDALRYRPNVQRSGALHPSVPASALGRVPNLQPQLLRLTLESLAVSFVSNLIGAAPKPKSRFTLIAKETTFELTAGIEGYDAHNQTPFDNDPLLTCLAHHLEQFFDRSLSSLYHFQADK